MKSWVANGFNQLTQQTVGGEMELRGNVAPKSTVKINNQHAEMREGGVVAASGTEWRKKEIAAAGQNTFSLKATEDAPPGFVPQVLNKTITVNIQPEPQISYQYDADGNMLTDGITSYEWDAENRLVAVTSSPMGRVEFVYDAFSRRVRIIEKAAGTFAVTADKKLVWEGTEIVQQYDSVTTTVKHYFGHGETHTVIGPNPPVTLIVLSDTDTLLRFNDATPGTVVTTTVTGLGASEDLVGIDFRPADGRLYGLTIDGSNAGRLYTISPVTGVATLVASLAADPADATSPFAALSGASFGLDFNPVADRLRVVSDTGQNLRINPANGLTNTDTALNPGTPDVGAAGYTNSFPGATSTTLYDIDPTTDQLLIQNPPNNGTLAVVGSGLGVNATGVAGFDIGHGRGEAFAALTVGGVTGLYRIDLTTGAATLAGSIGAGTTALRGLAVVQHTWDGDGGNDRLGNAANWVAGIAPVSGDSLIFPAEPANKTLSNQLSATRFNAVRFTGDGYTFPPNSSVLTRITDGVYVTHTTGTTTIAGDYLLESPTGAVPIVDVVAGGTLVLNNVTTSPQGANFTGGGTIKIGIFNTFGALGTALVVNGPNVEVGSFFSNAAPVTLQSGSLTLSGSPSSTTDLHPLTVTGGTLGGAGSAGPVTMNGGTLLTDDEGLTIQGNLNLGAAATGRFVIPAGALSFTSLKVNGNVTLAGALDFFAAGTSAPPTITLIANDGTDAVVGTFPGFAEGAIIPIFGRDYTLSYVGGDGNDVTLTGERVPITILPGGKSATFTDVDGDRVTFAVTKGDLNNADFILRDAGSGRAQLEQVDFLGDTGFAGTSITLTAKRQGADGDGNVNVGYLNATNLDLGVVKISGDLGAIDAGDAAPKTLSVKSLAVHSIGSFGLATGAPDLRSDLDGRVGSIAIRGDFRDAFINVFDRLSDTPISSGDGEAFINSLTIGGSVIGGAGPNSGSILVGDGLLKATIGGNIIGGAGDRSGTIRSRDSLGKITVRGSILGGSGDGSGGLDASTDGAESFTVLGDLIGGTGDFSGAIETDDKLGNLFLGGSVFGGAGTFAGYFDIGGPVKNVTINGDILGGSGRFSGLVALDKSSGSFLLGGSVVAGSGTSSGGLEFAESIASLTILGSIVGREGSLAGQVSVDDDLGKLTLGGSVIGGSGLESGRLEVGTLKSGTIRGSVVGGLGQRSGTLEAEGIGSLTVGSFIGGSGADSGSLSSNETIGTLKVLGSVVGGSGDRSGQFSGSFTGANSIEITGSLLSGTGATSGSIVIDHAIGKLKVGGEIRGTADDPVIISGGGRVPNGGSAAIGIASLAVGGGVTHARILGGYDIFGVARNADAVIGSVTIGGDWNASSLVAGLAAGADTFFGTADDAIISGSGTTNDANLSSRIGSVTIKGQVLGTPAAGGGFGIVAQEIGALKVGPVSFSFTANADAFVLGATGDFLARELGAAAPVAGPVGPAAALVNPQTVTFTDVDGDLVTVKVSAGTLALGTNFVFAASGVGQQLQHLVLTDPAFAGASVTITAQRSASGGDGSVNVGYLNATGNDLGKVSIAGDLGALDAGDATPKTLSVKSLAVQSLGVFGLTTGAPDLESDLDGRVGSIAIRGDLRDAIIDVFDRTVDTGNQGSGSSGDGEAFINSLTIGGSLIGGVGASAGAIFVRDGILKATIGGSIVGGAGNASGLISSFDSLGAITIGGSVFGGVGNASGKINTVTDGVESLTIRGSIIGGTGPNSGEIDISDFEGGRSTKSFFLGGSVIGGAGSGSAQIDFAGPVTKAAIGGDLIGGAGQFSALVSFEETGGSFLLGGSIAGGTANFTAQLNFEESLGTLAIVGPIVARSGTFSAQVEVDDDLGKLTMGGSLIGGGQGSGQLDVGGLKSGTIRGSIVGGSGAGSGQLDATGIGSLTVGSLIGGVGADSGVLQMSTGSVGKLKILGSLFGGSGDRSGNFSLFNGTVASLDITGSVASGAGAASGSILVGGAFGALKVGGAILGTADDPVTITGGGLVPVGGSSAIGIASVAVGGGVSYARFLAGYDIGVTANNADAVIGSVTIGGDWIASCLVAGIAAGADTFFGTADDALISGSGTTNDANLTSRIASILIKGQLLGTPGGTDAFGFVAEQIGKLKVGTVAYPLTGAPNEILVLGATGDFNAREDV